ncbi:MAG TPA: sigma 54-interacting transcriptional regulator [Soehngenia sp.]|nr:sigma 54-interacting transcriptional regulator [Soehngenia sp.]HPP31850.1 sigma 54-interacting transcriptional regulator [Soehngenia sp.]
MPEKDISSYEVANAFESGIIILDKMFKVVYTNKRAKRLLKKDTNEFEYDLLLKEIISEIKIIDYTNETAIRKKIKYLDLEYMFHISRVEIKKEVYVLVNFNELDLCKSVIGTINTEMEASSLLKTIMEATNDCIVYVNKEGYIEMLSNAYAEFLNVDRDDSIGKHVTEVIENTRMHEVAKLGVEEVAQVQEINGRKMIATRIPVYVNGRIVGAVGKVLFRDLDELEQLYTKVYKIEKELNMYKNEFKKINSAKYELDSIIGESREIKELKELTKRIANTNSNVLILGETGTGKELFANAIHSLSKRKDGPFIKVNCGSIPSELLESELFGYEEGAFTGAKKGGKIGKFKAADGGSIFLDEIADLPMNMQVKLLRVLQEKEIEKIGSNTPEKIDVRIISATNKDLEEMIKKGEFRLDLYYRLNVVSMVIPPLRKRKEDIAVLSNKLIEEISKEEKIKVDGISKGALDLLKKYDWPGNVRELENVLERAINYLDGETIIKIKHLPMKISGLKEDRELKSLKEEMEEHEKEIVSNALLASNGNKTKAAEILKISRTALYEKIEKYSLQ